MAKEIVAMILAGGRGSRLYALTQKTAKPAVSFGGKYRIVDFPLSNCVNSNIDTVGIATQYQPQKLNEYIGNGQPWDLDRLYGGVHTLPPYEQAKGTDWYKGTANAIYQNIPFIESYDPEYVIILSGDQICKQDYADFLRFHKEKGAEFSVAVMEVDWKEASRFGLMVADEDDKITEFQEKPLCRSQPGFHGHLHLQLGYPQEVPGRGRGRPQLQERLRHEHHPRAAARRPQDVCLPLQRLLA